MLKLNISYDIEKDAENYLKTIYNFEYPDDGCNIKYFSRFLYPSQLNEIKKAKDKDEAKNIILNILQKWYTNNKLLIEMDANILYRLWEHKRETYKKGVEKIYGKSLNWRNISVFFTTIEICPYNFKERWFMTSIRSGIELQLQLIFHELFHFVFYEYYYSYCKEKLNDSQFHNLKESLIVLLNTKYFSEITSIYESNRVNQKKLGSFLWQEYAKNPDSFNFQEVLDKAISLKDSLLSQ